MEVRQAAALHPDSQGQARRSAGRRGNAGRRARPAARFRRRVLLQGIRRAAPPAPGAGTAQGLRAAGRRDRQVGRRIRIPAARDPLGLPGQHSRTRNRGGCGEADGDLDLQRRARSFRCAQAPLPASSHRLPRTEARGAHRRKPRAWNREIPAHADRRLHQPGPHSRSEEAAVGQRNHRLGARAGAAAVFGAGSSDRQGHAQRALEIRGRHRDHAAPGDDLRRQSRTARRVRLGALMREELHRFFRAARGAGVRVSPAESIDAMKAVADVGFGDRDILRDTLLLTLAKNQDEKRALGETFDLFFSQPEVKDEAAPEDAAQGALPDSTSSETPPGGDAGAPAPQMGELAQMLMSRDRNAIAAAMANAASAASLSDIRYFTQRGIFSTRILEALGIERLRDDMDALTATNPAEAERLAAALEALRENVRDVVSQALLLYGREESENLRNEILRNAPLARLERRQVEQMKALIRAIARRLRERYSKPRKRQRRGHLDVRRTLRRNAAWGGIPFLTSWKRRHRDRPKIVALCDVAGSVAQVSDFFLLLIHSLHEVVDDVRSFAFSGHLIEVSDILDTKSPEEAMKEIMSKVGFGSSDYGGSLVDFEKGWIRSVTPKTTVVVLGDARTNNLDPRADILRTISERSKRLVWLNPEGRMAWGWGDSEMPRYAAFCSVVRQCATAKQLERAVSDIVAAYQ